MSSYQKKVHELYHRSTNVQYKIIKENNFKIIEVVESEGILRNFLFLNNYAGTSIRFFKFFISDIVTYADYISLKLFGESNYFIVARRL